MTAKQEAKGERLSVWETLTAGEPNLKSIMAEGDRKSLMYGFIPVERRDVAGLDVRYRRFTPAVERVWTAPRGAIIEGLVEERSEVFGKRRVIHGRFKVRVLGCADVVVAGRKEVTKVFQLSFPARSYNARAIPPTDEIRTVTSRSYVSLKSGMTVRVESPGGTVQVHRTLRLR